MNRTINSGPINSGTIHELDTDPETAPAGGASAPSSPGEGSAQPHTLKLSGGARVDTPLEGSAGGQR